MIHLFRGVEFLLFADAIDGTGYPPGTVLRLPPEDFAPNQIMHSLHDIRLPDVLEAAQLIGLKPAADCIGVQVENLSPPELHMGLSDSVEAAIPRAVAAVLHVLEEHGVIAEMRTDDDADAAFQAAVATAQADIAAKQSAQD
jgi:hydrogenase maturation protease